MSDSFVLDPDRLPWLADEEPSYRLRPPRRWPQVVLFALIAWALLVGLVLVGAALWRDTAGPGSLDQVSPSALPGQQPAPAPHQIEEHHTALPDPAPAEGSHLVSEVPGNIHSGPSTARLVDPVVPGTLIDSHLSARSDAAARPQPAAAQACSAGEAGGAAAACGEGDVARLNNALALLYSQSWTSADSAKRAQLLRTQDRFVARLRACQTAECKRAVYVARMRQVSEISRRDWQTPQARVGADPNLARLNAQLASLYSQSWSRAGEAKRTKLLQTQDRFVERLDECRSAACLNGVYVNRMREVSEIMANRS